MPEFKILANIINFMEENGVTAQNVRFEVDQKLADEVNLTHGTKYTVPDLEKAVDKCIANEWIQHNSLGDKYKRLSLTSKGVGAVRSKLKSEEVKMSRTPLKKASDYIEEHKGLFAFITLIFAFATLLAKFLGAK